MRRAVALVFHAPGLRLLYDERLTPELARYNSLAVVATMGLIALAWYSAPGDVRAVRALVAFAAGHFAWGAYLAWRLPPRS